ncbi:hypothetical protein [Anaeromicropila populeti]|uniref:DNA and RNA helicase n=1 Tax=Anaeromicropila populeti TaxID=37658 RepID=A0A1I6L1T2_9FIRM|nr:hypothetical protein [Anaeromicropila populeti]SFR97415.1 hypothetical protein SAMN05661086_02998 [Anaeromicropila populeti]
MFQDSYPMFSRDMILKAEMLENIKDYPRELNNIMFQHHSNGVICGADIIISDGKCISIAPGIVKYNNVLYRLSGIKTCDEYAIGTEQIVKICFCDTYEDIYEVRNESTIIINGEEPNQKNEMELCRFILKDGAVLRQDYQNFLDFTTQHNTINIINVNYSCIGESTISPVVLYQFATEMLGYRLSDPFDISFSMLCMQQQPVNRTLIEKYIQRRVDNVAKGKLTNKQIHSYLSKILEMAKLGKDSPGMHRGNTRRMLVD